MKIAITGHRPNKLGNDYDLISNLVRHIKGELQSIINEHKPTQLISGMALGIDTLWAKLAIENNIPLLAALPCQNQDKMWPQKSKLIYKDILDNPLTTSHLVTDCEYNSKCMQDRNIYMVDNCDLLVAVWDGASGGTGNCVRYANSVDKKIIIINPNLYKFI